MQKLFRIMWLPACVVATVCSLTTARATVPDPGLGARIAATCAACHRMDGRPDGIPPIDGLATGTLVNMMTIFRTNSRANPVMRAVSLSLSDDETAAVALYLAGVGRDAGHK